MTAAAAPTSTYSLNSPPPGASFDFDEVKGDRGQKSLGIRPLLTWNKDASGVDGAIAFYGHTGVALILNGTSVRVTAQGIARRVTEKGLKETPAWDDNRINEEIAKLQLEYRPGERASGQSTGASRAANAAKKAAGKISGDSIASLLERVAAMSPEERAAFGSQFGLDLSAPQAENGDEPEGESEQA